MATSGTTGIKLYIGGQGALATESGWEEVGQVQSIGDIGDSAEIINFLSLGDGRTRKSKGTFDSGNVEITVGFDAFDTGQTNLESAAADTGSNTYNFKIEANDAPATSGGTPTTLEFEAIVAGFRYGIGTANNTFTASTTLAVDSALDRTLAAS